VAPKGIAISLFEYNIGSIKEMSEVTILLNFNIILENIVQCH